MTKSCAIPSCDTGRKVVTEKLSVFKVPAKSELRKKWIAAIPELSHLTSSQFICEKHFREHHIRRKWEKYDADGRLIAQAFYARARLDPSAVPEIFATPNKMTDNAITANISMKHHISREHSYCSLSESAANQSHSDIRIGTPMDMAKEISSDLVVDTPTDEPTNTPMSTLMDTTINWQINESVKDEVCETLSVPFTVSSMGGSLDVVDDQIVEPSSSQDVETKDGATTTIESIQDQQTDPSVHSASEVLDCRFEISDVTLSCIAEGTTNSISIPQSWGVNKLIMDEGSFLFSFTITKKENGDNVPVYERSVKLRMNKQLSYYVYGRTVDVHDANLPSVLGDITLLPPTLERFKSMNLCVGIGSVDGRNLLSNKTFQDCVNRWHAENCTLISKRKRCDHCVKTRGIAMRKMARSNARGAFSFLKIL